MVPEPVYLNALRPPTVTSAVPETSALMRDVPVADA